MAHHPVSGHGSPDDDYIETPLGSTYEHTDASVRPVASFMLWLAVAAVLVHFGLAGAYQLMINQGAALETGERRYPLAAGQETRLPPTPRLQQFPENERHQFRLEEDAQLGSYGWESKAAGTVRIPIAEAMRLTVERGLPARVTDGAAPVTPGMMPADSSSGRTLERRRQ